MCNITAESSSDYSAGWKLDVQFAKKKLVSMLVKVNCEEKLAARDVALNHCTAALGNHDTD